MHNKLKICSWNCKGYRSRIQDLKLLLREHKPDVLMLQETHLPSDHQLKISGYKTYIKNPHQGTRQGGLAIIVATNIPSLEISLNTPYQVLALRVGSTYPITISNVYLDHNIKVTQAELDNIVQQITGPYLLAGDFNAHSQMWGSPKRDARGAIVEEFIDKNNLFLHNDNQTTYVDARSGKQDSIDLAVSSLTLSRLVDFSVLSDLYGSDHYPLMLTVFPENKVQHVEEHWAFKRADWETFKHHLSQLPQYQPEENSSIDQTVDSFQNYLVNSILEAAQESIPKIKTTNNRPRVPWWNSECKRALRDRRKALWQFKRNVTQENFDYFKKARAHCKHVFKEAKKASWRNYVSDINQHTEPAEVWRKMKILSGKQVGKSNVVVQRANTTITDPKEVAEEIGIHFAKVSATNSYSTDFQEIKKKAESNPPSFNSKNDELYNRNFTMWELESTIKTLKNTAPGPDKIHNIMIKNLPNSFLKQLLKLFNMLWENDLYIHCWREAILLPIPKPGKNPLLAESYRPIAMTNTLGKLIEKMVNFRLVWILESKQLLSPHQVGFRRNRSTIDHLASLETYIRDGFVQGKSTIGVFFDCEKAYDRTWRFEIIKQIHKLGFRGHLPKFINNFLTQRTFRVKVGNKLSSLFDQENGVPQGAVLSVTLFLLAVHGAIEVIPKCVEPLLYVDDFTLLFRAKTAETAVDVMQQCINKLSTWARKIGLKFSPTKTQSILFTRRNIRYQPRLKLFGQIIPVTKQIKYLGLTLDTKLSWKPHIEYLAANCKKGLNLIRIVQGYNWGADRHTLLILYKQLIRSKLDYGSVIYASAKKSQLLKLEPIQNSGLRLALGAFRTSPVESLQAESNEPSLEQRRNLLLLRYGYKILQYPDNITSKLFISPKFMDQYQDKECVAKPVGVRWKELLRIFDLTDLPIPTPHTMPETPPWITKKPCIKMQRREPGNDHKEHFRILEMFKGAEHVYCDASKNLIGAGCAIVHKSNTRKFSCTKWSSITTLELEAIRQSAQYLIDLKAQKAVIFTDSKSSLDTLTKLHTQNLTVGNLRDMIASSSIRLKFCWVPSHTKISGNETADREAKLAIDNGQKQDTPVTWKDLDQVFKRKLNEEWQNRWTDMTNNKLRQIKPFLSSWKTSNRQDRREETRLARLRIGHTRLTHSYLFTRDQTIPKCRFCNDHLSIKHILMDCIELDQLRTKHNIPETMQEILSDNEQTVQRLLSFLTEADLLNEI